MLNIKTIPLFDKIYKKYSKKYKNLESDLKTLINTLEENPSKWILLKNNLYKIRVKNSNNNKWKSGWYRFIYYYHLKDEIIFSFMYSKNDISNISERDIDEMLAELSEFI